MDSQDQIVAVGLLTRRDLKALGSSFERVYAIEEAPCLAGLLQAIDDADREIWRERDRRNTAGVVTRSALR